MWSFLRRQGLYFLIGFIITFLVYLTFKLGTDEMVTGIAIGAAGGILSSAGLFWLERRFPDNSEKVEPPG